ncbi:outer membrane phospholipase A [Alcanivorax sp. 521-1]|uniref:Phospholipase A1 n=1 Tax=Alloalcanivorax profundimaris TaxID=2735259 RepID=A0ABS0AW20_9GAMM|nr:phospholipase A [Alloalcanivorax profundimaris]MBF5058140.1 outer membrane phospholipase A [Alloalcanivorax profundimaris]QJX02900.1 phospholipase A [Alcanivorax sp. IO_7]
MTRSLLALLLALAAPLHAAEQDDRPPVPDADQTMTREQKQNDCLLRAARDAADDITAAQLRGWCLENEERPEQRSAHEDALRTRLALERSSQDNPFVITPHRRNYLMPYSHWSNPQWNDPDRQGQNLDSQEVKFQISLKAPLYDDFWDGSTLYMAFTGLFFWQAYNKSESSPFREINFTPEIFVAKPMDWELGPVKTKLMTFGFRHDSNGRDEPTSRSWNRLYLRHISQIGPYYVSLMPWYRIPEDDKDYPLDPRGDNNPDIEKYMGHFELEVGRAFGNHVLEVMVRNNLRSDNKGAGRVNYSFPINERFKGLVQVFTGYGDSMINYDDYETRFSLGILLTDTL